MFPRLLPALLVVVLVAACGGAPVSPSASVTPTRPGATGPATLVGTVWRAISVDGQPVVIGHEPTAAFTATEVNGTTGCNSYGGSYTYAAGTIAFGPMRMTMMACIGPIGEVESRFTAALTGATTAITNAAGHLLIEGSAGSIEFVTIIT